MVYEANSKVSSNNSSLEKTLDNVQFNNRAKLSCAALAHARSMLHHAARPTARGLWGLSINRSNNCLQTPFRRSCSNHQRPPAVPALLVPAAV